MLNKKIKNKITKMERLKIDCAENAVFFIN